MPLLTWLSASAIAATLDVCGTCAYTTVGDAVADASPGDTVQVAAGVYDETDLVIDFDLTLIGAGSSVTTLRSASDQVLHLGSTAATFSTVWPTIEVSGFELEPTAGRGAYLVATTATLTDIRVDDRTGTESGLGVWVDSADVTIVDSTFEDLVTTGSGAGVYWYPTVSAYGSWALRLEGCTFQRNTAASGGAVAGASTYAIYSSDSLFSANAAADGGAVSAHWGLVSTADTFVRNSATGEGGAVHGDGIRVTGSTFSENSAAYGGAIAERTWPGSPTVTDGVLEYNQASVAGGDLYATWVTLTNTTVTGSYAPSGGSVSNPFGGNITLDRVTVSGVQSDDYAFGDAFHGSFSVVDSTFEDIDGDALYSVTSDPLVVARSSFSNVRGTAVLGTDASVDVQESSFLDNESGASVRSWVASSLTVSNSTFVGHTDSALYVSEGTLDVSGSVFERNASPDEGGAIGGFEVRGMVLRDNVFRSGAASAGGAIGIPSSGHSVLTGNRFCGNTADTGGAVSLRAGWSSSGTSEWRGNLFAGNTATDAGGDLYLQSSATVVNNTFVDGYAPAGGAVWSESDLDFRNNIVVGAQEYALYGAGGAATIAYNDFWEVAPDAVGGTWPSADSTNLAVDPMFVSYVEGGCEELDLGLLPGSPLWDAGDPSGTDADGSRTDIGATGGASPGPGTRRWYLDGDGDGVGLGESVAYGPTAPSGYAAVIGDCDDADPDAFPGNTETCDGVDEDCDGVVDDAATDATTWRLDADGDGYQEGASVRSCEQPPGWEPASGSTDCDDADPSVNPGAAELCDGIDQDCDGKIDDGVMTAWRPDADGDGYQSAEEVEACEGPPGWMEASGPVDCDDADPESNPGAAEIAGDGIDQDCDGADGEAPDTDRPSDTDAGRAVGGGCKGCGGGGNPAGFLALAALALTRRTLRSGLGRPRRAAFLG